MTVRILGEADRQETLRLLERDHAMNLIMIYDVETFGLQNRGHLFQGDYLGAFRGPELCGVACLYNFGSLWIYPAEEPCTEELARAVARTERPPRFLISRSDWAAAVLEKLEERGVRPWRVEPQEYLMLTRRAFRPHAAGGGARPAAPEDLDALLALNRAFQVEYFGACTEAEEEMGRMARQRMREAGITVAERQGRIVSKAEGMVRTRRMACIGGVYTLPAHRRQGCATACTSLLCQRILETREAVCLNVALDNGPARRLYRGLGFGPLCPVWMVQFPAQEGGCRETAVRGA